MRSRPAELLTGVVGSALALLTAFGVNMTDDQMAAVIGFVSWIPAVVTGFVEFTKRK